MIVDNDPQARKIPHIGVGNTDAITCVIDSSKAGKSVSEVCNIDKDIPILENINEAFKFGAEVLLLGTAPSGGRLPESWIQIIGQSIEKGLSVVNGLHDSVNDIFSEKLP